MAIYVDAPKIIFDFITYLSASKGCSARTLDGYFRDIRLFFRFFLHKYDSLQKDVPIDEVDISGLSESDVKRVTLEDGTAFMLYLQTERNNSEYARSRKATSLRMYFKYLTNRKFLFEKNPFEELELPKLKKSLPKFLNLEQSTRLLNSVSGKNAERNYCIITLFLNCGMRLDELHKLNVNDINYEDRSVIITGKGNKERLVYLNDACIWALKRYMEVRPNDSAKDKKALFISQKGNRLSRRMVEQIVTDTLKKAGLAEQGFSTHKLRHTAATLMYQYGNVDVRILQEMLGHENLGTTQIYTHVSNEQMRRASQANPLSETRRKNKD